MSPQVLFITIISHLICYHQVRSPTPIWLDVMLEGNSFYTRFYFQGDTFDEMYSCMTHELTSTCIMNGAYSTPEIAYVTRVGTVQGGAKATTFDYYKCEFSYSDMEMQCTRYTDNLCSGSACQSFRYCRSALEQCLRIHMKTKIKYDTSGDFLDCNSTCPRNSAPESTVIIGPEPTAHSTTTATTPPSTTPTASTIITPASTNTDAENNSTALIAGIIGAIAIGTAIVIGFFLYRRRVQRNLCGVERGQNPRPEKPPGNHPLPPIPDERNNNDDYASLTDYSGRNSYRKTNPSEVTSTQGSKGYYNPYFSVNNESMFDTATSTSDNGYIDPVSHDSSSACSGRSQDGEDTEVLKPEIILMK